MKKTIFFVPLMALIFASCTKEDVQNPNSVASQAVSNQKSSSITKALENIASANKFTGMEVVTANVEYKLEKSSGDFTATLQSSNSTDVVFEVKKGSTIKTYTVSTKSDSIEIDDSGTTVYYTGGSYFDDEMDDFHVAALLAVNYYELSVTNDQVFPVPQISWWYCWHMSESTMQCSRENMEAEVTAYCGHPNWSSADIDTSCMWEEHFCLSTAEVDCG
jgi:hypothetical protein